MGGIENEIWEAGDATSSDMNFRGLMQVPHITGAVLLSRAIYREVRFTPGTPKENIWAPFYHRVLSKMSPARGGALFF
ncbi:hypothetical protein SK128_020701 [Halocaridina rubra]|uniref:Uncharacterized protein n=1 Tax=Halocaridina rubra TaxID=373956 RepID=A0AAN8ZSK6_HALRR